MSSIELKNIHKNICQNVNLQVKDGELLVCVGPTGAGKTTLLNVIAGIAQYDGTVLIDGNPVDDLTPDMRKVGYLFQDLALFPHLNVASNIAYGLKVQKKKKEIRERRVSELLNFLHLGHLRKRFPSELSGGERQRVALARALAPSPGILLLDEPLSSLDPIISKYLRMELKRVIERMEITGVYVTHDLEEAEEMADRLALIHQGQIQQISEPQEMIFSPRNQTVSYFVGMPNILECDSIHVLEQGLMEVRCQDISIFMPYEGHRIQKIAIFPADISISQDKNSTAKINCFKGIVVDIERISLVARLKAQVGRNTLLAEMPAEVFRQMDLEVGKEVLLTLKTRRMRCAELEN